MYNPVKEYEKHDREHQPLTPRCCKECPEFEESDIIASCEQPQCKLAEHHCPITEEPKAGICKQSGEIVTSCHYGGCEV